MLQNFKNYLLVNGKSESTVNNYLIAVKDLFNNIKLEDLTKENIDNYFLNLRQIKNIQTVNLYKSGIRRFLEHINRDIEVPKNEKIDEKLPEFITEEYFENEIIPLIESVCVNRIKMKAILYFMFYSGLRVGEVVLLKRENIDLNNRTLKFYIPKRKKERLGIIASKKAKKFIEDYFSLEPEDINAFNINYHALKRRFHDYKHYFKSINFHPHLLRHSFATHLRKKGVPLEDIKELMGHSNIQTTMIYAHVNIDDIKSRCDKLLK